MMRLITGDCLSVMPTLPENSVDSVITDPPYGLDFMGKSWDHGVPGVEFWQAALRVAKPGAILMAFGGTRTFHRLACAIEDAGWEMRDTMCWLYGSGFPKSLDISKAIDKAAGAEREVVGIDEARKARFGKAFDGSVSDSQIWPSAPRNADITAPSTPAAHLWQGYGTALKPAWEPIIVAMKPLEGTYAENAQKWGVAGLNIDGARITTDETIENHSRSAAAAISKGKYGDSCEQETHQTTGQAIGRWPANLLLDETSAALLDQQSGKSFSSGGGGNKAPGKNGIYGSFNGKNYGPLGFSDHGGASRFFYTAKSSRSERNAGLEEAVTWENADLEQDLQKVVSLARDTCAAMTLPQGDSAWSTILCGNRSTDLSLPTMKYTIETVTRLITALKTSNFSLTSITSDFILDATRMLMVGGSSLANTVDRLSQLIPNITNEQMASALGAVLAVLRTLLPISEKGRRGNIHSTVKPVDLMRYLCKLTRTPTGGVVLDPFMGSGTTGIACILEHRDFIGIEIDEKYAEIAKKRIADMEGPLFQVDK